MELKKAKHILEDRNHYWSGWISIANFVDCEFWEVEDE